MLSAFKVAAVRTMAFAVRKVAYDSAVWLASGAKGQNSFANTDKFGDYLTEVGDQAAGTFIEQLGGDKLNLCHLPDVKVDLALKLGLRTNFAGSAGAPAKPDCSLSQLAHNWGQEFDSRYGGDWKQQQTVAAALERQEGKGFRAKESPISGKILTPPSLIEEQFKGNTPDKQAKEDSETAKQALVSDDPSVLAVGLSIFLNTLVSTAITNWRERGALPTDIGVTAGDENAIPTGGAQVAADFYRELQTVKIGEVANYDVLSQLSSCPDSPGTYNCRASDDLAAAIKKAETGKPVTIGQALAPGGGLRGEFSLIPPTSAKNKERDCYTSAYCYGNIQVMRQLRILPLGFEIAALNSDPDHPWTLKEVVAGFDDCQYIDPSNHSLGIVNDTSGHPFCHLIDPNWVLKAPLTKCKAKAPGAVLFDAGAPNRLEDCVDVQTCVHYDADGKCDNYGYCAREENAWKFSADTCESYAATCRTFTSQSGQKAGQKVSYLYRTLDTGFCSEQNSGCTAYSLSQQNGEWQGADIYFNKNVSNSCSAGSEGCSAFLVNASDTNDLLYLKKAPNYLNCYDAKPATPEVVDWPESVADLNRIKPDSACKNYAAVCIKDEVSCNSYTPSAGGQPVPGRYTPREIVDGQIKWNDECAAACVGYAAYREMPSRYSTGAALAYVVPSSGTVCAAADEGCAGFTNLGTTDGGLEKTEYFTKLRPCVMPEKDKGKTYITYEGSRAAGFQLKTYILVENKEEENGPLGAPKYFYKDAEELQNNLAECTEERYKSGAASADCRQFNDEEGRIFYRLLSFTIPVSSACTAYRLSNPELDENGRCLHNGELRDGSCFYNGLPGGAKNSAGESQTCGANVDTCRAYKGTSGGIAGQIFEDTFENASTTLALRGWSGAIQLSAESTHTGEHSLFISSAGGSKKAALDLGARFEAAFWAKGAGRLVTVQLKRDDGAPETLGTITPGDTWNYYRLGSVEAGGAAASGVLIFTPAGGGSVWVDNVSLNHSTDLIYLVKRTLSVPAVCDSNLDDNLPGEALGCAAYADANNKPVNLTNFSRLCRASAIGCTAVLDTQNTVTTDNNGAYQTGDEGARAYNVWLTANGGATASVVLGADTYSCTVPVGAVGCYLEEPILNHSASEIQIAAGAGSFVESTVYIPGDTPAESPIYLVANKPATCNRVDLGCTVAGIAKATPTGVKYATTTIKNDPNGAAGYEKTLCPKEAVGCSVYTDTANAPYYFKDPDVVGQKICAYRTNVTVNSNKVSGWFWKGVGKCSGNSSGYCSGDSDCGIGAQCADIDSQPCYPDFFENSGAYGLWSYGNTAKYQNFVGECKNSQDRCAEFVDHLSTNIADPSKNVSRAYYLINDPVKLNGGDCVGAVSQKTGCALFDQTDNPKKRWSRELSYAESEKKSAPVPAVASAVSDKPNDSNVILKVTSDRECGEWLQCSHYFQTTDDSGRTKQVCQSLERCSKKGTGEDCGSEVKSDYTDNLLTESLYRDRNVTWSGRDYDGYSLLGLYPLEELTQFNVSTTANPDWRLVKSIPCGRGTNSNCAAGAEATDSLCGREGAACGGGNRGICVNGVCIKEIHGGGDSASLAGSPAQTCRAYPEKTSPFPHTKRIKESPNFSQANVCDESYPSTEYKRAPESNACECDYTKVGYGGVLTRYFNYSKPSSVEPIIEKADGTEVRGVPGGICQGGDQDGKACGGDTDCHRNGADGTIDGVCEKKKDVRKFVGWRGFCLEQDKTRAINAENNEFPCLTWLPIDALEGAPDIYNQHTEAGFLNPSSGGKLYCLRADGSNFTGTPRNNYLIDSSASSYCGNIEEKSLDIETQSRYVNGELVYNCSVHNRYSTSHRGYYNVLDGLAGGVNEKNIRQSDVEKIIVHSNNYNKDFVITPNDFNGQKAGKYQSYFVIGGNQVALGNYLGRPNEFIMLVANGTNDNSIAISHIDEATGNFKFQTKDIAGNDLLGLNGNLFKAGDLKFGVESKQDLWEVDGEAETDKMCPVNDKVFQDNIAWWYALRLVFDEQTHKFSKYYHAACNALNAAAAAPWRWSDTVSVSFKNKEWCSYIGDATVDTVNDDFSLPRTVAWTDRIWKQVETINSSGVVPPYKYSTEHALYGSLSIDVVPSDSPQVVLTPMGTIACPEGATDCRQNLDNSAPKYTIGAPYSCLNSLCVRSLPEKQTVSVGYNDHRDW
ncbi:MAG: hypothetical protein UY44_C0004G0033 [Candidatus Kaiserbacteria bacterium GW2011_GWA2_49_19]|uniref:Uncharacterized protein n=1 Tax=Candidatus Kaiserbacteria bacterium GW2011_GWA2_49_19 TaxID=1618669 RepID=A0A0G1VS34_9BACT|nr:MAG: hypothetical protein UY44_C0004G0033 [Candidatus Kaiserbacteria bacterium GW2011_GWA2_49_19]